MESEYNIFLSYSRLDSAFALRVANNLEHNGINIWVDQSDITGGRHWDSEIQSAIDNCVCMVVVLSDNSVKSQNVLDEISYALDEGKQILPILISRCKIPYRIRRIQHIDFSKNYENGLKELLQTLKEINNGKSVSAKNGKPELSQRLSLAQALWKFRNYAAMVIIAAVLISAVIFIVNNNVRNTDNRGNEIPGLESSLAANFQAEDYGNAERIADKILEIDPKNKRALTVKGAIAYMNEEYQTTAKYYLKALQSDTTNPVIMSNLAWVYTDLGASELALNLLNKIQDGKPDWFERVARANLYNNNFREALNYLKSVPGTYHNGVAKIQQAACVMGILKTENDTALIRQHSEEAKEKLDQGIGQNEDFWKAILAGRKKDPKWPMKKEIELLRPILTESVLQ